MICGRIPESLPLLTNKVQREFAIGDRVVVSPDFSWAQGATGKIGEPPPEVVAISGGWEGGLTRLVKTNRGDATFYWVWFDQPQRDADGDGPYGGAEFQENALALISDTPT